MALLTAYPWPGNVRELAAVIERAAILVNGGPLEVATALGTAAPGPLIAPTDGSMSSKDVDPAGRDLDGAMRRHIEAALGDCLGRIEGPFGAAQRLGINPNTLRGRMRRLKIDWRRFPPSAPEAATTPYPASTLPARTPLRSTLSQLPRTPQP